MFFAARQCEALAWLLYGLRYFPEFGNTHEPPGKVGMVVDDQNISPNACAQARRPAFVIYEFWV